MANFFKTINNTIKNWWLLLIVGALFLGVGIYTMTTPQESYVALSILFSITFIVGGILEIIFSISNRKEMDNWGWALFMGIISLTVGVLLFSNPDVTEAILPFYVGFLVLFRSVQGISYSLDMKSYGILDWGNIMVVSVLGAIFSFILLFNPFFAGMTLVFWTGLVLILAGVAGIYFSFQLRKIKRTPQRLSKDLSDRYEKLQKDIQDELSQVRNTVQNAVGGGNKAKS